MKYRLLGNSGLRVSEISLGTMTFGEDWGWGAAKDESRKMYDAYREAGGNFIDTANIYTNGTSESPPREHRARNEVQQFIPDQGRKRLRQSTQEHGAGRRS
jgi:aryl-alcohol dehydrogenase-like predicted oxidoreductase